MTVDSTRAPAGATTLTKDKPDEELVIAWGRRSIAYALYDAGPMDDEPGYNPNHDHEQLTIVDSAENEIRKLVATTPLGVEIQLWTALFHTEVTDKRPDSDAANVMDLDHFMAKESDWDWKDRLILAAIRSLRTMQLGGAK